MEEGKEGEHFRRRIPEQERQAHGHLQPGWSPFCAIVMRQQLIMKLFEGLKGRAVPSVGICKILTSDTHSEA